MEFIKNPVTEAILERRSIRAYTTEKISDSELHTILQCGLWAPSGRNEQTPLIIATQNEELLKEFAASVGEKCVLGYNAPCCIFVVDKRGNKWAPQNASFALENMHLAAYSLGLGSIMIGMIYDFMYTEKGREWQKRLGAGEEYDFVCGLAVGHTAAPTEKRPRNQENLLILP